METQKGPYTDYSPFIGRLIWVSMLVWGSVYGQNMRGVTGLCFCILSESEEGCLPQSRPSQQKDLPKTDAFCPQNKGCDYGCVPYLRKSHVALIFPWNLQMLCLSPVTLNAPPTASADPRLYPTATVQAAETEIWGFPKGDIWGYIVDI